MRRHDAVANKIGVAALVAISFAPHLVAAPLLGPINVVLLAVIWLFVIVLILKAGRVAAISAIAIGATLISIPPSPYYIYGDWFFYFIGLNRLIDNYYGILFFLVFHFLIFCGAYRLLKPRDVSQFHERPTDSSRHQRGSTMLLYAGDPFALEPPEEW